MRMRHGFALLPSLALAEFLNLNNTSLYHLSQIDLDERQYHHGSKDALDLLHFLRLFVVDFAREDA
jgi:hypothetical protein